MHLFVLCLGEGDSFVYFYKYGSGCTQGEASLRKTKFKKSTGETEPTLAKYSPSVF